MLPQEPEMQMVTQQRDDNIDLKGVKDTINNKGPQQKQATGGPAKGQQKPVTGGPAKGQQKPATGGPA